MPYETTSGGSNPGVASRACKNTQELLYEYLSRQSELFFEHLPKMFERLHVEISSRVYLECLSNPENISRIILFDAKKKNRLISDDVYEVFLNFREGVILMPPGGWRHCPTGVFGESLPELLAHIESIRLYEAERRLAGKLIRDEKSALQNWKPAGWQWDDMPLYKSLPPAGLGAQNTNWRKYKTKTEAAGLIAHQIFINHTWVIEYYSRWHRHRASRSHWVKALPPGKLPLYTVHRHDPSSESTVLIVSTEFDNRFLSARPDQLIAAIPGGARNFNRTDLSLLAGRSVYIELLPYEMQFALEIEKALLASKVGKVSIKVLGRSEPDFPLSDLRQIASEYGVHLPSGVIPAPRLSSVGLLSADEPLPLAGSKRPQILEPIIREAGLLWFYGAEKIGKTWLALALAQAIATGGSFGPWKALKQRKVLFIDGEMRPDDLDSAIRAVSRGDGNRQKLAFSVLCAKKTVSRRISLLDPEWRNEILKIAGDFDLIIFDSFYSLTNNKAAEFPIIFDFIENLQAKKIGVIIIDHANSKGDIQGTLTKRRVSEAIIQLRIPEGRDPREKVRIIEVIKSDSGNSEAVESFIGKMIFGADTFNFEIEAPKSSEASEPIPDEIAKLAPIVIAKDNDRLSFREFLPKLGIKKSTAEDRYKRAKSLTGPDKDALDREIQRLLDERKAAE